MGSVLLPRSGKVGVTATAPRTWRPHTIDSTIAAIGDWMRLHQRAIRRIQWAVVGIYLSLLTLPVLLPIPASGERIWNNLTLLSQFVFWGIWWPFVLLSMVLVGRAWCGILCPEGSLAEAVSRSSRGWAIPRWITWKGWPFAAFVGTTVYGQMISVYQYPAPALVILGLSTLAAIATSIFWGRNKRVWCRYLCPVSGVFTVLSKLAPLHYRVDTRAWDNWKKPRGARPEFVNCAPLVPLRDMKGASACHMCGRCQGFRGAITLARRSPNHEIIHVAGKEPRPVETLLIVCGLLGVAAGAFHWGNSAAYIAVKQWIAEWLVAQGISWPLSTSLPWWVLTNYPEQNDVMTLLDGGVLIGYMAAMAAASGVIGSASLALAVRALGPWSSNRFHHLAQCLIPIAGCGVFLGLSMITVTILRQNGFDMLFVPVTRALMLGGATVWSFWLAWQVLGLYATSTLRRFAALLPVSLLLLYCCALWGTLFWSF